MTHAYFSRFSREQQTDVMIRVEDITEDYMTPHPDDESHLGIPVSSFIWGDALLIGDWFVTSNGEQVRATCNARNGHRLEVFADDLADSIKFWVTNPSTGEKVKKKIPEDIKELVSSFVYAIGIDDE
jgi:hypothetical protein